MDKRLVLQPIYDDKMGEAMGAEVLSRVHVDKTILRPEDFLNTGADSAYTWRNLDLGSLRLLDASEDIRSHPGVMFINVSDETLVSRGVFRDWLDALQDVVADRSEHGSVVVEIKDSNILSEQYLTNCINAIRSTGAGICSDNFGSRFASTTHLYGFDWDFVKFDWRPTNRDDDVWRNITAAANHCFISGIRGVLLGVERESDVYRARDAGISLLQGYFFGGEI
jgi:EAL domain-containing protein (putative c-di-GMP-specific phosphodiesterase class I)